MEETVHAKIAPHTQEIGGYVPIYPDSLHDLSSPVNQISTAFELFLMRRNQPASQSDDGLLKLIQASMARMHRQMDALRKCSASADAPFEPREYDGGTVLSAALATLEPLIRQTAARIESGELPTLFCDSTLMTVVFVNLLENALRFRADCAPEVRIAAQTWPGETVISVRDNGIGIDPRHHESIFHIFKRVNGDRYPGTGAGLPIARAILQRHGGRLWVESSLGTGSSFLVALPAAR